jgi:acyl carrier protein
VAFFVFHPGKLDHIYWPVLAVIHYEAQGNEMNELIHDLKVKIIDTLNLIDVAPENIIEDAQLIGGDLGLDSIDVLELVMMLEKDYGLRIDSKELGVKVFASLASLADYVHHHQPERNV